MVFKVKIKRVFPVLVYSVSQLIGPFSQFVFSYLIIKSSGIQLWGEYVALLLIPNLAIQVMAWGNKEYLLRQFSLNPGEIGKNWRSSLINRFPVFVVITISYMVFGEDNCKYLVIYFLLSMFLNQSLQVMIVYQRKYNFLILQEVLFLIFTTLIFISIRNITLEILLLLFTSISISKFIIGLIIFNKELFKTINVELDRKYLLNSFSFFILTLGGLLASKMDLYAVNYYLSKEDLARYQILNTFLFAIQSFSNYLIAPYLKNFYRFSSESKLKFGRVIQGLGILLPIPLLLFIHTILSFFYKIFFPLDIFILSYFFVLPIYFYGSYAYHLFSEKRENIVTVVSISGSVVSLLLCLLLLPIYGLRGALISSTIMQWYILFALKFSTKSNFIIKAS